MQLMLLSYGESRLALLPSKMCAYDKMLNCCYTGNPDIDGVINPQNESEFSQYLYRSQFCDYCVVSSPKLEGNVMFLYGNNPSGKPVYIVFLHPNGLIPDIFEQGLVLDNSNFLSSGFLGDIILNATSEERTIALFDQISSQLEIFAKTSISYITQMNYFNSSGELFNTDYKTVTLKNVTVDSVGEQIFCMKFQ
ncbi:hypothetical protein [Ehrlichia muris]|uniref:Uncharacterized protein n=1 Tax=Ehrlichia muris AS145 TaxID=1423892 RepID=V9R7G0_9RICK|nr:hypothetical protein [Ehrlichia muris]AHC39720.1 hypothetical protein EMUR_02535 [Ehrlichia muris AS145]